MSLTYCNQFLNEIYCVNSSREFCLGQNLILLPNDRWNREGRYDNSMTHNVYFDIYKEPNQDFEEQVVKVDQMRR